MKSFFRWLFNEPTVTRFNPEEVTAYHGSYTNSNRHGIIEQNVTAHLASGREVKLTNKELQNLLEDDLYFCGDHPLIAKMIKRRG